MPLRPLRDQSPAISGASERTLRWASACVALLTVAVLIKNAWVAEDAFIVFRVIEQLWAGNGPVFNLGERVQVYTSPLWFLLLAAGRALAPDPFVLILAVSVGLWVATLTLLRSIFGNSAVFVTGLLVMLLSSSFFDFTASGLENSLAYVTLLWSIAAYLPLHREATSVEPSRARTERVLGRFLLGVGVTLCVRHDLLTLVAVPTIFSLILVRRILPARTLIRLGILAGAPLALWTAFSIVYYGFPFPNTAYAKLQTGVPRVELLSQGARYLADAARFDPVTPFVVAAAVAICLRSRAPASLRALGGGVASNIAYVVWVGGDFMRGRFLSFAFLVALVICLLALRDLASARIRRYAVLATVAGLAAGSILPSGRAPLTHPPRTFAVGFNSGITDERSYYQPTHRVLPNLPRPFAAEGPRPIEQHRFALAARRFRDSGQRFAVADNVGTFAYYAALDQHVVDILGLTDPLLARLPTLSPWRIGHFRRSLPKGYLDTLKGNENQLDDPAIRSLYDELHSAARSPVGSSARWLTLLSRIGTRRTHDVSDDYLAEDFLLHHEVFLGELGPSSRPTVAPSPGPR